MKNLNRLTAAVLAVIMLISCFAVAAFADEEPGHTVSVKFELCHEVDGTWTPATEFEKGEAVKLRVYVGTDFHAGNIDMAFFYDNDFFEDDYATTGALNLNAGNATSQYLDSTSTGSWYSKSKMNLNNKDLVVKNIITVDYYDTHNVFQISTAYVDTVKNAQFDFSTWLFDFDLKVRTDASTRGSVFIIPESALTSTSGSSKGLSISKYRAATGNLVSASNWKGTESFGFEPVYNLIPATATRQGAAEGITLDAEEGISLAKGKTANLSATVSPADAENKSVIWSSSDESVATVDSGVVTGVGKGTATITVTTEDGGFTDTVDVSVFIPASSIKAPTYNPSVEKGGTASLLSGASQLIISLTPADTDISDLVFTSQNENIATVDEYGVITGVAGGSTYITVSSKTDPTVKADVPVDVTVSATGVSFYVPEITIRPGEITSLEAEVEPADSTDTLTFSSSDATVVTVSKTGTVEALKKGTAVITVETDSGKTATITVKVENPATRIYVDGAADAGVPNNHYTGDTFDLVVLTDPEDADEVSFTYSSSVPTVATVSETGKVTVNTPGTTVITIETEDGKLSTTYIVRAIRGVKSVSLDTHEATVDRGNTVALTATVKPDTASNRNVTWSSSNPSVASVKDGVVTGVSKGTAVITVTTEDGGFTDTCQVEVTVDVRDVTVESSLINMNYGDEEYIEISVSPADADDLAATYSSSDDTVVAVAEDEPVAGGTGKAKITAKAGGTAVVTISVGGKETKVTVNVKRNAESVSASGSRDITIAPGDSKRLDVTISPADTTEKNLTYSSSDPSVASVDANGNVTANGEGTAKITVTAPGGKYVEFNITVKDPNPCAGVTISAPSGRTIGWKSRPRIVASASGLPEEYKGRYFLQLYEEGSPVGDKSADLSIDITRGSLKSDTDYSVKVVDKSGNVQKDASGKELRKDFTVTVAKKFFFDKIIAFFKYIFSLFSAPFGFKRPIEKI